MMTLQVPAAMAYVDDDETGVMWVVGPDMGAIHGLSASAGLIWEACDGARDAPEVVKRLVWLHDWNPNEIAPYVEALLESFRRNGLIEEVS